ncbi:MAG TPA: VWA domain-containing protein [Vicinamibacterales bacterium]|nr:VWA domain-containing protein [Vicinamibacterales bacterium]
MHQPTVAWAAGLAAVGLLSAGVALASGQQFRSTTGIVRLPVIVTGKAGAVVQGLTREDFVVLEDGVPQQVEFFAEGAPGDALPLRLGLLLDTSGSMERDLREAASAVIRFVDACAEASDVTFVDFDTTVQLGRFSPPSFPMLFSRIRELKPGRMTALYDALAVYLQSAAGRRGQHVLVLFSDGGDTASSITYPRLQQMLRTSDVLIYAIGYLENQPSTSRIRQQMELRRIAQDTGGEAHFPTSTRAIDEAYGRILAEVTSRYTLGYVPREPRGERFRRVEVRLSSADAHPGATVRTRAGYVAAGAAGRR